MNRAYLNKLNKEGVLKELYMQGVLPPIIFLHLEIINKYDSLAIIKKRSEKVNLLAQYFGKSKQQIRYILRRFNE